MSNLPLLWELPLGLLSFGFSGLVKGTLTLVSRYYNPNDRQALPQWQVTDGDFLRSPLKLLWVMSRARWNLHALIAIAGPFTVNRELTLDTQALGQSALSWTAVVYTLQGYRTVTSVGSLGLPPTQGEVTIPLPAGRYLVGVRHYDWQDPVQLPAIAVDGTPTLATETLVAPPDFNQFYRQLPARRGWLYSALNFYVYPLLRWGQGLPQPWVKHVFLPVPNPETYFFYGALDRGERLALEVPAEVLKTHRLYFSLYSRDCFPLDWYPISTPSHTTAPLPEQAVYILRVHPQLPEGLGADLPPLTLTTLGQQPSP